MKKILTLALLSFFNTLSAQVDIDFDNQQLPQNWTMQGSFSISNAAIHPICKQNSLIGSFFTPSNDFWLQTDTYTYDGNDVNINMTYGIKDLYHELGVSTPFQKPQLFLEYSEGSSASWTEHEEISLANISQSQTCLTYSTTINAVDLLGYQTIKYRLVYKSPVQTGTLYLLYWSVDDLQIEEQIPTPCQTPQEPQAQNYQTVPEGSTLADLDVTGQDLKWYADASLTSEISEITLVTDLEVYYVTQTVSGCESQPFAITVHLEVLSVNDFVLSDVKFYPNPVKDVLNISCGQEITEIEIFNLAGQLVLNKQINSNSTVIDLVRFPQGSYIVKIKSGNSQKSLKVIKR